MHYLVTGGCGFIGSHLVRQLLADNHEVTVLDDLSTGKKENLPAGAKLVVGDILDEALVSSLLIKASDGCFHLAAIPSVERCLNEWSATTQVNVLGTVNIFEACRKAAPSPIPVVYASSAAVYGATNDVAVEDTTLTQPISSYGVDKLACEYYGQIAWNNHQLPNIGLRFFNVYGAGQPKDSPYSGVITCFMQAFEQEKSINIFGDGEQTRDFIFVGDVVNSCIAAMHSPNKEAGIYNVCTGNAVSISHVAETMAAIYNKPLHVEYKEARVGDIRHSCGSNEKLNAHIPSIHPAVELQQGLTQTIYPPHL